MILSSHYVIKDILHTVKRRDAEEVKKICEKYTGRYKNDHDLFDICNVVLQGLENPTEDQYSEMEVKLEELISMRRLDSSGGTALWYADRRKGSR